MPEYHIQLQPWFQWSSELGVLLLEAMRQSVEQEVVHVWRHAQVVSERLHIIVPKIDHKVVVLACLDSLIFCSSGPHLEQFLAISSSDPLYPSFQQDLGLGTDVGMMLNHQINLEKS